MLEAMPAVASFRRPGGDPAVAQGGKISTRRPNLAGGPLHDRQYWLRPVETMTFQVYAIQEFASERVYVGQTQDLAKRLAEHNAGHVFSTKHGAPWHLLASEEVQTRAQARWLERQLKNSRGTRERWLLQHPVREL